MDETIITLLNDRISEVKADLKEINNKVDDLLRFKWQIVGGSLVLSTIFSVLTSILVNMLNK